jgi:hypothetical protein
MILDKNSKILKDKLYIIGLKLQEVLTELQEANMEGKQMDYCTHPSLAGEVDRVMTIASKINKIMYQK